MGLRAIVMKEKLKHMLVERIEQLTRLNVSLEQERTKANEKADRSTIGPHLRANFLCLEGEG